MVGNVAEGCWLNLRYVKDQIDSTEVVGEFN